METLSILVKQEKAGGEIHACPYCRRYVKREKGTKVCMACGGRVDNNRMRAYRGRIIFDGGKSWREQKKK